MTTAEPALAPGAGAAPTPRVQDFQDMSARQMAALIPAREVPSAEVADHFIARLSAVNSKLNAVTVELFDRARKTAASVDHALARGEKPGPLAGLPVTVKECFDLAGTASTFGLLSRRNIIAPQPLFPRHRGPSLCLLLNRAYRGFESDIVRFMPMSGHRQAHD